MKFFIDTANVEDIRKANDMGVICGVTTNPSLIAKEGRDFKEVIKEITSIVDGPISGEVKATTVDAEGMIKEGREIAAIHPNMVVKIPMTVEGLKAVKVLSAEGIKTNVTLIFTANQALLAAATKTGIFKKAFPERHIDCGIAEANMTGIAAGLSTCGKVPFVSTFAMFAAGRAYEQVRNSIGYPHLNVKIGATHAGISVGEDGATHQCNEDIGLMREIPGMVIINPSDDVEARAAVRAAYEYVGPVYLRFGRLAVPVINDNPEYKFEIGKGVELRKGKDITIFATGLCVSETLKAAETLAANGIDAQVINIHTIKPLDEELVLKEAKQTGRVYTVEEHSIIGGLGSAVAELLGEKCPTKITRIGVKDVFGESGPAKELLHKYELDAEGIAKRIMEEQKSC